MTATFIRKLRQHWYYATISLYKLDPPYNNGDREFPYAGVAKDGHNYYIIGLQSDAEPDGSTGMISEGPQSLESFGYALVKPNVPRCHECEIDIANLPSRVGPNCSRRCMPCHNRLSVRCSDCDDVCHRDVMRQRGDTFICQGCFDDHYFSCRRCGGMEVIDDERDGMCPACYSQHVEEWGPIRSHDSQDYLDLGKFGNPKDDVFFGVELEVCVKKGIPRALLAQEVLDRVENFAIVKHDGSLNQDRRYDLGFEIVSAPATVEILAHRFSWLRDNPVKGLVSWDTTCAGMHVHVSRKPLSRLTVGKILAFVSSRTNFGLLDVVAGRSPNDYCRRTTRQIKEAHPHHHRSSFNLDRYQNFNMRNEDTVEFRMFRGTLSYPGFMKNVEFVRALVDWAPTASTSRLTSTEFISFVSQRRKDYINLFNFFCHRNLITTRVRVPEEVSCA